LNAAVTVKVTTPEAIPVTERFPISTYLPLVLVKVIVWPGVRAVGVGMMVVEPVEVDASDVPVRGTGDRDAAWVAAIAGYATSSATIAKTDTALIAAIFVVFIFFFLKAAELSGSI
jgi:hypothetical protein